MANKRFYWFKLKEDFLLQDDGPADLMMQQPNGAEYVLLYLMLCLKAVNTDGKFITRQGEIVVKYSAKKIQKDCKHFSIDTVRVALELYRQMGLIYEDEEGIVNITDFDELIGSETDSAQRVRKLRENRKIKALQCNLQCNTEKDIDIEEDINIELDKTTTAHTHAINDPLIRQEVLVHDSWGIPVSAILLISNSQIENLHKSLSEDELYHYIEKMREMTLNDYKFSCSHYEYILKMADADRRI